MVAYDKGREGIALIIVLGMLAVMMVLGVAFVTAMRTERVAAGNFMEVIKARHLVYTALARAMDDIEDDLDYYDSQYGSATYPSHWQTSYDPLDIVDGALDLHTGDAQVLLPREFFLDARKLASPGEVASASAGTVTDTHAEWGGGGGVNNMWIERIPYGGTASSTGTVSAVSGQTLTTSISGWSANDLYRLPLPQWQEVEGGGRIGYLVVDASGLLDAGYVGGAPSRERGASPREILVGDPMGGIDLPGVNENQSPRFATERDDYTNAMGYVGYGFETMSEMFDNNNALNPTDITYLSVYSRFPGTVRDAISGSEVGLVDIIGKSDGDLQIEENDIREALARSFAAGASPADPPDWSSAAEVAFGNLLDYVDTDSVPQHLDGPYVEATPLINEVWIQNVFNVSGDDMSGTVIVWVECAYPFVEPNGVTFQVQETITIDSTNEIVFMPDQQIPPVTFPANPSAMYTALPVAVFPVTSTNVGAAFFQMTFEAEVQGGGTVDRIPPLTLVYQPSMLPGGNGAHDFVPVGMDVIDPVHNWHITHWIGSATPGMYWEPYDNTPSAVNESTQKYMGLAEDNTDVASTGGTVPYLHVANEPVSTVGELGYLVSPGPFPFNNGDSGTFGVLLAADPQLVVAAGGGNQWLPTRLWRTVWLYDHGTVSITSSGSGTTYDTSWARMLDYFNQLGVPTGLTAVHGAVNPNTPLPDVLASVFMNMQIDEYFDSPAASISSWNSSAGLWGRGALQLADALQVQIREVPPVSPVDPKDVDINLGGPIDRLSDLGRTDISTALFNVMENVKANLTEMEKESFYRNAAGLLNPRQNVFLVLLAGKSPIAVEQRALAIVWRDPIPDSSGRHPSFIRWFTWLEE